MKIFYIAKSHFAVFLIPVIMLLGTNYVFDAPDKMVGKVVIVDAGHGGIDSGANRPGILEKDVNLAVAIQLKDVLNQQGVKVVLSRQIDRELSLDCDNEDVKGRYKRDLMARVEMVEESDADLFVSIHANAVTNNKRNGAEVFYYNKSEAGRALANSIQIELCNVTKIQKAAQEADYFVLRRNKIPAALIEVGYITNLDERHLLQTPEYQRKLAEAIAKGVYAYYQTCEGVGSL